MTNHVLLVVPADRQVTGAVATALDLAATRGTGLIAAVAIDHEAVTRLPERMMEAGLLAEKMTDQVSEALAREFRVRAEALLGEIAAQATERGIPCRTVVEDGDPGEVLQRLVTTEAVPVAVLATEKRSWLARLVSGGQSLRPPALSGCEVVLVEED